MDLKKTAGMAPIAAADALARSADVVAENVDAMRTLFPEAFTEGKVDFTVLKQLLGGLVDEREEKYGLNWHGKRRARQLALTPSAGTLRPAREESVDWDTTQNLMIEGDNLEVLKLLQKSYAGKVKLIYIDPPYNTGKDFVYPDNFQDSIRNYLELTGQAEGGAKISSNTETSGRFHTDWLNMVYPRLKLARNLLARDGTLAISIGEAELANLLLVANEVFGEENLVTVCSRVMKTGGQKGTHFSPSVDYILIFAKAIEDLAPFRAEIGQNVIDKVYTRIAHSGSRAGERYRSMGLYQAMLDKRANQRFYIECPDGELVIPPGVTFPSEHREGAQVAPGDGDGVWRWTYSRYAAEKAKGNVEFVKSERTSLVTPDGSPAQWNVYYRIWLNDRLEDGQLPGNILEKFESRHSSAELKALNIPFDFAKPSALIKFLMAICGVKAGDLTLDFFAGSASTAHAAMELAAETGQARPFICVQLPEPNEPDSAEFKAGFPTIFSIAAERVRRVGAALSRRYPTTGSDFGFRVFKLDSSNLRVWDPERDDLEQTLLEHQEHVKPDRSEADLLYELLLKLGLDLCVPIERREMAEKEVHSIGGGVLMACLATSIAREEVEVLAQGIVAWHQELAPAGEPTCVFRDSAFADDVVKTNLAAILQQHGIRNVRSL